MNTNDTPFGCCFDVYLQSVIKGIVLQRRESAWMHVFQSYFDLSYSNWKSIDKFPVLESDKKLL